MSISVTVYTEITVNRKAQLLTIYSTLLSSYLLISFNSLDALELYFPQFIHSVFLPFVVFLLLLLCVILGVSLTDLPWANTPLYQNLGSLSVWLAKARLNRWKDF